MTIQRTMKSNRWHIWVIKQGKFDAVKRYLDKDVPEVKEIFYPTKIKERRAGNRMIKRREPLYSGYLFLRYEDKGYIVHNKLRKNPFITTYVGVCDDPAIDQMKTKEEWNVLNKEVELGNEVEVICGPMKGCTGSVESICGNNITINIPLFGRLIKAVFLSEDVEITKK